MARIRSIKPELREHTAFAQLSDRAARVFVMLYTLVDDEGRCPASPAFLHGAIYFARPSTPQAIGRAIAELEASGLVKRYTIGLATYAEIVGWREQGSVTHQRIDKPQPARYPAPSATHSGNGSTIGSGNDSGNDSQTDSRTDLLPGPGSGSGSGSALPPVFDLGVVLPSEASGSGVHGGSRSRSATSVPATSVPTTRPARTGARSAQLGAANAPDATTCSTAQTTACAGSDTANAEPATERAALAEEDQAVEEVIAIHSDLFFEKYGAPPSACGPRVRERVRACVREHGPAEVARRARNAFASERSDTKPVTLANLIDFFDDFVIGFDFDDAIPIRTAAP